MNTTNITSYLTLLNVLSTSSNDFIPRKATLMAVGRGGQWMDTFVTKPNVPDRMI